MKDEVGPDDKELPFFAPHPLKLNPPQKQHHNETTVLTDQFTIKKKFVHETILVSFCTKRMEAGDGTEQERHLCCKYVQNAHWFNDF